MSEIEIWDGYYEDGSLAGIELIRGAKIPTGIHHGVAEVFVMHEDGEILLMKRDYSKPNYPGQWESGASGSILKGESFLEGARRELKEETGIDGFDFQPIYRFVSADTIYQGYLYIANIDKSQITLQRGETIDYQWVNQEAFKSIYNSEGFVDCLKDRLADFVKASLGLNE